MKNTHATALLITLATVICSAMDKAAMTSLPYPGHPLGGMAFGYLDPSTGSMIVSAIVGVIAAVALTFKTVWYTITRPFRKKKPADDTPTGDTPKPGDAPRQ